MVGKPLKWTTDLPAAMSDSSYAIFFDASGTLQRARFIEMAVKAGKAIYCEKPTAVATSEALRLATLCEQAGLKNGVVQDKLWLPGNAENPHAPAAGILRRSSVSSRGIWLLGLHRRNRRSTRPAPQLELPQRRRRRNHHRHVLPLAVCDRQPVRPNRITCRLRQHRYSATR